MEVGDHVGRIIVVGSLNYDIAVRTQSIPKLGETVMGESIAYNCGGKGGNQAYACAKAGAQTKMIGAVGDDACAEVLVDSLKQAGVDICHLRRVKGCCSGNAVVVIDDAGRNSIIVIPGANERITDTYVRELQSEFCQADVVLLQMEIPLAVIYETMRIAKAKGCKLILNPAPVQPIDPQYYPLIDYLTPNETELDNLIEGNGTVEEKARALNRLGIAHVIVTLGEKGALLADENGISYFAARMVEAVDSVGAGDCFNGYFCAALAEGRTNDEAIRIAIAASSLSVTRPGAQCSIPGRTEVIDLMEGEKHHV